jgi:hypothetical protein
MSQNMATFSNQIVAVIAIVTQKAEPVFMKLSMYIMTTEPHLTSILHKSLPSVIPTLHPFTGKS